MKKKTYDDVLTLINKVLVRNSKKPVEKISPGTPRQYSSCPIAQTLKNGSFSGHEVNVGGGAFDVDGVNLLTPEERTAMRGHPKPIYEFITEVDSRFSIVDPLTLIEPEDDEPIYPPQE